MANTKAMAKKFRDKLAAKFYDFVHPEEKEPRERAEAIAQAGPLPDNVTDGLNSVGWRPIFEDWVRARNIGENVDFIRDVEIYERGPNPQRLANIVDEYIRPGAPQQVTIDDDRIVNALVTAARQGQQAPDPHLFDRAKNAIVSQNLTGRWIAFAAEMSSLHT